jgi:hypothetical protein
MALETAHRLHPALALRFLALQIGPRLRVKVSTGDRDDVQGAVELAIAAAIKAMAVLSAGGDGNRWPTPGLLKELGAIRPDQVA